MFLKKPMCNAQSFFYQTWVFRSQNTECKKALVSMLTFLSTEPGVVDCLNGTCSSFLSSSLGIRKLGLMCSMNRLLVLENLERCLVIYR